MDLLKTKKNTIKESYKHEIFVLEIQTEWKIINISEYKNFKKDIGDIDFKYNPEFWKGFSLPSPKALFRKKCKRIESIYGVPLEVQFKAVNR